MATQATGPAGASASAGQALSLQTQNNPAPVVVPEVANPSAEGVLSDSSLRSLARQRFEQARLDLEGLYESQGRALPFKYRALSEPAASAPVIPTVPHTPPKEIPQTAATAPSIVKPPTVGLRPSALAGAGKPSPASTASLASPAGFIQKYSRAGKARRPPAARGLTFASPETSTPRTHRHVSSDLPYSLLLCDPARLEEAGYPDLASAQHDLNKFRQWSADGDSRRDLLLARLITAGLDPEPADLPAIQDPAQVALSDPDSVAGGPSGSGPHQPAALLAAGGAESDSEEEEGPGLGAGAAVAEAVPVPHLDRGILKELPKSINLDNFSSVSFGFTRFEIVTGLYGLCRDLYVSLPIPLFDQPFLVEFQERTRLVAVHHWLGTQGGNVSYEALKSVVFKVATDADLKSRDPPAKVYTITADTKGRTQAAQPGKRAGATQPKKSKKAKKNAAANLAAISASASGAAAGRTEPTARKAIIDNMSKNEGLCSRCLQP